MQPKNYYPANAAVTQGTHYQLLLYMLNQTSTLLKSILDKYYPMNREKTM
ncbi:hypothetical protein [Chitinophaga sp. Cy-1792]|nr:hypothetical protein [Chitinophaga sp. Cy-1792]